MSCCNPLLAIPSTRGVTQLTQKNSLKKLLQVTLKHIRMLDSICQLCQCTCEYELVHQGIHFCTVCTENFPLLDEMCAMCGDLAPQSFVKGPVLCGSCLHQPRVFDQTFCVGWYESWLRILMLRYKRGKEYQLSMSFAGLLYRVLKHKSVFNLQTPESDVLITSVPCSRATYQSNRYDPAMQIALHLAQHLDFPFQDTLKRKVFFSRKRQQNLSFKQRIAIPENQYSIKQHFFKSASAKSNRAMLAGKTVILVDDVITTGATVNLCSTKLKAVGADKVKLSHALKPVKVNNKA